jgi:hypothetical protein
MNALIPSLDAQKPIFADLGRAIDVAASSANREWCGSITLVSWSTTEAGGAGTKQGGSRQHKTSAMRANFGCSADLHPPVLFPPMRVRSTYPCGIKPLRLP